MDNKVFKIEEHRSKDRISKFILKERVMFWWEKVAIHPSYRSSRFSFVRLSTGVDYVNKHKGELISIEVKINKKKK